MYFKSLHSPIKYKKGLYTDTSKGHVLILLIPMQSFFTSTCTTASTNNIIPNLKPSESVPVGHSTHSLLFLVISSSEGNIEMAVYGDKFTSFDIVYTFLCSVWNIYTEPYIHGYVCTSVPPISSLRSSGDMSRAISRVR